MRPRHWLIALLLGCAAAFALQFAIFRLPAVFSSNLGTRLYDNGWWVERPAKVLVLGGSNAMNSVVANEVARLNGLAQGEVVNLGMNQATPFECHVSLQKHIARHGRPQAVYYAFTARFFYEGYMVEKDYERIFLNFAQWRRLERDGISNNYFFPLNIWLNSLHFQPAHKLQQFQLSTTKTRLNHGYQQQFHHDFEREALRPVFFPHPDRRLFPVSRFQVRHFLDMVDECQRAGIEFYILLTPVFHTLHRNELSHPDRYADLWACLQEGGRAFKVIGSINPATYELSYDDFANQDHLCDSGALIYTRREMGDLSRHANLQERPLSSAWGP